MTGFFLGVDVGTGSARAGLFDVAGKLVRGCGEAGLKTLLIKDGILSGKSEQELQALFRKHSATTDYQAPRLCW